jgi:phosphoglucan,water dikinase
VIPFGVMEESLHATPDLEKEYELLVSKLNDLAPGDLVEALSKLRDIVLQLQVPDEILSNVIERFSRNNRLMVRSSASCEDLEGLAAAGLYESIANVPPAEVAEAVRKVWASLWARRAASNRRKLGIPHEKTYMAVLIQQMLVPEFSFIMHTANPTTHDPDEVYVELAVGLGQTLASVEQPGTPYRMICNKYTASVKILASASFSHALWPDSERGLIRKTLDYSDIELSTDESFRDYLGRRLGAIGRFVEGCLGRPQEIEGVVLDGTVHLVQSRPQQGIG